jgi:hypothetical protein
LRQHWWENGRRELHLSNPQVTAQRPGISGDDMKATLE